MFANGRLEPTPLAGVPRGRATGQGGLLDVCLHPTSRGTACSTCPIRRPRSRVAARPRWRAPSWATAACAGSRPIFEALPRASGGLHFGSRIAFDRAGLMYVTAGERYTEPRAQDLDDLGGKIVRLSDDGTVPPDNPFVGRAGARPEIFT